MSRHQGSAFKSLVTCLLQDARMWDTDYVLYSPKYTNTVLQRVLPEEKELTVFVGIHADMPFSGLHLLHLIYGVMFPHHFLLS